RAGRIVLHWEEEMNHETHETHEKVLTYSRFSRGSQSPAVLRAAPWADARQGIPCLLFFVFFVSFVVSPPSGAGDPSRARKPSKRKIVGYFMAWGVYQRKYHVSDIPAAKLTHVNYAFAMISAKGECTLVDVFAATEKFYPGDTRDAGALRGNLHQL